MLQLENLSKNYGSKTVLHNLNLFLEGGKTHVLLGSSGCGKSTILKLICGLIKPSSGRVTVDKSVVKEMSSQEAFQKIGYVIQEGGLFPHLTAEKNITLAAKTLGWSAEKRTQRISKLSQMVELDLELLTKYPKQLSGGQRQRVSLMRALFLDPEILLFDEPLGALDPIVRSNLQEELKKLFSSLNKTVVIVTHDVWEGAYLGHSISLLDEGKLIQHGTFEDLLKHPKSEFVTTFINAQLPPPELRALL